MGLSNLEKTLNKVLKLVTERKVPAKIYSGRGFGILIYTDKEIVRYYKVTLPDGNPATKHDQISKKDFLNWLYSQSKDIQKEVYKNLLNYVKNGRPLAPPSEYLFGY
mgnify:CR=1 FL=1